MLYESHPIDSPSVETECITYICLLFIQFLANVNPNIHIYKYIYMYITNQCVLQMWIHSALHTLFPYLAWPTSRRISLLRVEIHKDLTYAFLATLFIVPHHKYLVYINELYLTLGMPVSASRFGGDGIPIFWTTFTLIGP